MADQTQFGHDQLGHLLADYLLEVPRFQRSYAWDSSNVDEFLQDLAEARSRGAAYFMGTVVFAKPANTDERRQIVDGQQRLATTALLLIAVRDRLKEFGRDRQAEGIEKRFLRGYDISKNDDVNRLLLSPKDLSTYEALLDGELSSLAAKDPLYQGYLACVAHLEAIAPTGKDAEEILGVARQLDEQAQVLVAEASDLPEAYVIFETLNDRGADLTTADLLKNYLFSSSLDYFRFVEERWTLLEKSFDKIEDLVKFIRYDFAARNGSTSSRRLYRNIQGEVKGNKRSAKSYIENLIKTHTTYLALRDPEHSFWGAVNVDVRDALYAYRRFGLEASMPVLLAAFGTWSVDDAARLLNRVVSWSIRGAIGGRLGGGVADETYADTAVAISSGTAKNQTDVRASLSRLIPSDTEFVAAFSSYGSTSTTRAKYLLAMMDKAEAARAQQAHTPVEWYSRAITIEHVMPKSKDAQGKAPEVHWIGNLALLEKRLNQQVGSSEFSKKKAIYRDSVFRLTSGLASRRVWTKRSISDRTKSLAEIACLAWPGD